MFPLKKNPAICTITQDEKGWTLASLKLTDLPHTASYLIVHN